MNKHALLFAAGLLFSSQAFAFGAIAVDTSIQTKEPAYGYSIGEATREAAERSAYNYCSQHSSKCKVIIWFKTCGAYATSRKVYGYGYGDTKAQATYDALKMCGNDHCEVRVAKCENNRGGGAH